MKRFDLQNYIFLNVIRYIIEAYTLNKKLSFPDYQINNTFLKR